MGTVVIAARHDKERAISNSYAALAQLGRQQEAAAALSDFRLHYPDRTISDLRPNYRWKDPADIDHFFDGLRKAGLPD